MSEVQGDDPGLKARKARSLDLIQAKRKRIRAEADQRFRERYGQGLIPEMEERFWRPPDEAS